MHEAVIWQTCVMQHYSMCTLLVFLSQIAPRLEYPWKNIVRFSEATNSIAKTKSKRLISDLWTFGRTPKSWKYLHFLCTKKERLQCIIVYRKFDVQHKSKAKPGPGEVFYRSALMYRMLGFTKISYFWSTELCRNNFM